MGIPTTLDSRVESALAWCGSRGIGSLTLALPFDLEPAIQCALLQRPEIESIVIGGICASGESAERVGRFLPDSYTWDLPQRLGHRIVYIGAQPGLTGPMIRGALRRGVKSFVCGELDDWSEWRIPRLVVRKIGSKLLSALQKLFDSVVRSREQVVKAVKNSALFYWLFAWFIDAYYYKSLRTALDAIEQSPYRDGVPVSGRVVIACPTLAAGGAERQIAYSAFALRARGIRDVTVLVTHLYSPPGYDFFLQTLIDGGVHVKELGETVRDVDGWVEQGSRLELGARLSAVCLRLTGLPEWFVQEVIALWVTFLELRPSVVHCWLDHSNICAGYAALLAGVPRIVVSGRNVSPAHFRYIHEPFMRAGYRLLAQQSEVVLVNNSYAGARDYAEWLGLPASRFYVIYNGVNMIDVTRAAPDAINRFRARYRIPNRALLVGGLFRFSDEKRPLYWLAVAARVLVARPDTYFLIFGAGLRQPQMEGYLLRRGLTDRIIIVPPTQENVLALSAFDLLLLTSQWEGTPNVAIEAQAVGTPVVVAGGGGTAEVLRQGITGLYVESGRVAEMAVAVTDLLADAPRRAAMRAAARLFVQERFAIERMLDDTLAAYGWAGGESGPDVPAAAGSQ